MLKCYSDLELSDSTPFRDKANAHSFLKTRKRRELYLGVDLHIDEECREVQHCEPEEVREWLHALGKPSDHNSIVSIVPYTYRPKINRI